MKISDNKIRIRLRALVRIFITLSLAGLLACSQSNVIIHASETMGTYYRVSYYGNGDYSSHIRNILSDVNTSISSWLLDFEINRFNSKPIGRPIKLSRELCEVVSFALQLGVLSDGAYDISIGRLVTNMGFAPKLGSQANSHRVTSLSVLNANTMQADAWATALFVMGAKRSMDAANRLKCLFTCC
ncbi:MAG: FAD:protein FMN transferase [Arenicellaceae bacterium]|nr:FAD:protein FMN transferase [Arenicellaceae bacterium]